MDLSVIRAVVITALSLATSACHTSRWYDLRFVPAPLELEVRADAVPGSQVRTLVSVLGIARASEGVAAHAVVRMRLENLGTTTAQLDDASLQLVSADLQSFGKGEIDAVPAHPPAPIAPGASASYDIDFPAPASHDPEGLDLQGLNLRWTMVFDEQRVTTGATFQRVERPVYYDEDPRVSVGFGYYRSN